MRAPRTTKPAPTHVVRKEDGSGVGVTTLTGLDQTLAVGPAASQVAIKQLGTNGGGFFNVNSAFPFENGTAFSGFVEICSSC